MANNQNMNGGRGEPSGSPLPASRRVTPKILSRRLIGGGALGLIALFGIAVVSSYFVLSTNCARTGTGINIAGQLLVSCGQSATAELGPATGSTTEVENEPAKVEHLEGMYPTRVKLTEEAANRLDIQTAQVREEPVVRTRRVGGEVVAFPTASTTTGASSKVWVRVSLNESDLKEVRLVESALVLPLAGGTGATGLKALPAKAPAVGDSEETTGALYYEVASEAHGLVPGQRVLVQLTLVGSGTQRKVIPYAAVLYDTQGDTWTYTNPEPLVFVRHPIVVNYIEGDLAVLRDGPAAGTAVVTVGVEELYGSETEFEEE